MITINGLTYLHDLTHLNIRYSNITADDVVQLTKVYIPEH